MSKERFKSKRKIYLILFTITLIAAIAAITAGPIMSNVEQPKYKIISLKDAIELRSYAPMIAAQTTVKGERETAINEGFRIIAAYIFGKNQTKSDIKMTAPVEQQKSQEIAMTAPVTQQGKEGKWTVQFIMPSKWTMETLPNPLDKRVKLVPIPEQKRIAIKFSGKADEALIKEKTIELKRYIESQNIIIIGDPLYAFYNPPWTLPFLKRNEIMFKIAEE